MGRITVNLPDELEKMLRHRVIQKYGSKRGALSKAVVEAVKLWLKQKS